MPLRVFGTDFFWPVKEGTTNPYFGQIPARGCDVLVAHGPARGFVDGGSGCAGLLRRVHALDDVRLVVSGHIHHAHGVARAVRARDGRGVVFANAANAGGAHHQMKHAPIVLEI